MEETFTIEDLSSQDLIDLVFGLQELQKSKHFDSERLKRTEDKLMGILTNPKPKPNHLYHGTDCYGNTGWFEDFEQSIGE